MKTSVLFARVALGALAIGAATAASARDVGPDSAGYAATDQVSYVFQDITGTGTKVLANVDDNSYAADMGFGFTFYGASYTTAFLSSNGVISFGGANSSYSNEDLTARQYGNGPAIFTYWDDLVTSGDSSRGVYFQTLGTAGHHQFIVQELANQYSIGGATINFQTVLDEATGSILMRYTQTAFGNANFDAGASATVGIQGNLAAGQVVQWGFNQANSVVSNSSICVRQGGGLCSAPVVGGTVPEPASWAMMIAGFGAVGAALRRRPRPAIRFA